MIHSPERHMTVNINLLFCLVCWITASRNLGLFNHVMVYDNQLKSLGQNFVESWLYAEADLVTVRLAIFQFSPTHLFTFRATTTGLMDFTGTPGT